MLALEQLDLKRIPAIKADVLRAWDRADELVVNYLLTNHDQLLDKARTLVINDEFGVISCGILSVDQQADVTVWSDSYISECSLHDNCQANGLIPPTFINAMKTPQGPFTTVILRLPKSHSLLIDQLTRLLPQLAPQAQVIVPVMVKHLDTSWYTQLTKQLGPLVPSLTVKKARLFFAHPHSQPHHQDNLGLRFDEHLAMAQPPTASIVNSWQYRSWQVSHYSGVYGRRRLDEGAAFLLSQWPQGTYQQVLDMGCGNGILSLQATDTWPQAKVYGIDESYMAVAAARLNSQNNGLADQCVFQVGHDLSGFADQSMDLVLCNPPFHQQRTVVDHVALAMFAEAARVLKPEGELWVVGNRHLGYHVKLKRWFRHITVKGRHTKFVVLACHK